MRKFFLFLTSFLLTNLLAAQINPPENPELAGEAKRHQAISSDDISMKNYRGAANSLHWLMTNVPDFFEGIYVDAYKAYEQLAAAESNRDLKVVMLDSMLISYRLKAEHFSLNEREKNNLAYKYYKYFKNDKSKIEAAFSAYRDAYASPKTVINNNIVAFMDILRRYIKFGHELSNNQVFKVYDQIMTVIELKKESGIDPKKLDQYSKIVSEILISIVSDGEDGIGCDFIEEKFGSPLDDNPNFDDAKRVFSLILNNECTDSPYYIKSVKIMWSAEPTAGIAKILARFHSENGELGLAAEWYEQAVEVSDTEEKKAVIKMNLANVYAANGEKSKARDAAYAAIGFDKGVSKEVFNFIGDLYYNSFNDCKKGVNKFQDYAVFMAAYDLYEKAGNAKGMAKAKAQFPSIAERHEANRVEGEKINVACWMNTSTKLKTRSTN